ncbi:MAG: S8 family peptidase, partial [Vicinamibacteria bacterium]
RDGRIERDSSWDDLLGHGTAVAATIRGHAPRASLYSIRVFHRRLEAHVEALLDAIHWAAEQKLDLLNLSLGCRRPEREKDFAGACDRASAAGVVVVSADPASGAISIAADYALEEDEIRFGGDRLLASPWARRRGELPREKNFHGTSFAVAHVTGIAARLMEEDDQVTGSSLREALARKASRP